MSTTLTRNFNKV